MVLTVSLFVDQGTDQPVQLHNEENQWLRRRQHDPRVHRRLCPWQQMVGVNSVMLLWHVFIFTPVNIKYVKENKLIFLSPTFFV